MKTILLFDPRFPDRAPTRYSLRDELASAAVRAGVAAALHPSDAGGLSIGGPLDPASLTPVVVQHGVNEDKLARILLPLSVVMVGANLGLLASIGLPVAPSGPGLPSFAIAPSISSDGTPQVEEIAALNLGLVTGGLIVSARLLRTDNGTVALADATIGSVQWQAQGTYRLEVTATGPGGSVTVQSAPIVVAAATVATLATPTLMRDPDTAAGTNPPAVVVGWAEGGVNRNSDAVQYQWSQTGAYSGNVSEFWLASQDGTEYLADFKVTTSGDLASGTFKARARIKRRNPDSSFSYSDWSADFVDTLAAPSLPPATTTWGLAARLINGGPFGNPQFSSDARTVRLGETKTLACGTSVVGRKAYTEVIVASMENGATVYTGDIGVVDERQLPMKFYNNAGDNNGQTQHTGWNSPNGEVGYDGGRHPATKLSYGPGDKIGILIEPLPATGTQTGSKISLYKNGTLYTSFATDIIEARITAASHGDYAFLRFNAGQEPFATAGMAAFQWG